MNVLAHAKERIAAVIAEIELLKQSEFPYDHSRIALDLLGAQFAQSRDLLYKVDPNESPDRIRPPCIVSLDELFNYVPLLGFILRSTNVRNAFEAYAPLLRLSQIILGPDTRLIISSEWNYSPHVYSAIDYLPGFVLIGLPAPESANPMLIPLAGHELGHSTWESCSSSNGIKKRIELLVLREITEERWDEYHSLYPELDKFDFLNNSIFAIQLWSTAYTCALKQTEEMFCDFFGVRLFAEAYLHAFEYLLSPGFPGKRQILYPNMKRRAAHIREAAEFMDVEIEEGFSECFMDADEPPEPKTRLLAATADTVSAAVVPELIKLAQEFPDSKGIPKRNPLQVSKISDGFHKVIPTATPHSLTDILNGGWHCYLDSTLWQDIPQIKEEDRDRALKDIMLKSMEASEAYERLRESE